MWVSLLRTFWLPSGRMTKLSPERWFSSFSSSLQATITSANCLMRPFPHWNRFFLCFQAFNDWNKIHALRRPFRQVLMYSKSQVTQGCIFDLGVVLWMTCSIVWTCSIRLILSTIMGYIVKWSLIYNSARRVSSYPINGRVSRLHSTYCHDDFSIAISMYCTDSVRSAYNS